MMTKRIWGGLLCMSLTLLLVGSLFAQEQRQRRQRRMPRWEGPPVGTVVKDFSLPILKGGTFTLSELRGKITVIELGACT